MAFVELDCPKPIDRLKLFKIYGSKIMRTGPGQFIYKKNSPFLILCSFLSLPFLALQIEAGKYGLGQIAVI